MRTMPSRPAVVPLLLGATAVLAAFATGGKLEDDPLPSWRHGPSKRALLAYVDRVSSETSPSRVPPRARIAVLDNDGTLWNEAPAYVQLVFALDRVRALAPEHPEWRRRQPFKAILENDREALARLDHRDAAALMAATHTGMTPEAFRRTVREWLGRARHPRFGRPYTALVYQPMVELVRHLTDRGFRVYVQRRT
jgi:hypothetical protein